MPDDAAETVDGNEIKTNYLLLNEAIAILNGLWNSIFIFLGFRTKQLLKYFTSTESETKSIILFFF